jgi:hypothetical protein
MAKKKAKEKAAPKVDKAALRRSEIAAAFAKLRYQDRDGHKIRPEQLQELEALVLKDA